MTIECRKVDYLNPQQGQWLVQLLDIYARDPMGGGRPLKASTRENLPQALAKRPQAFSFIAYFDNEPAGLINCFEGFSTFKCQPLVNIHDLAVKPEFRGKGIGLALLQAAEEEARHRGCCKLTLEVLEGNKVAQSAYLKFGFAGYELDPEMGSAQFWEKPL